MIKAASAATGNVCPLAARPTDHQTDTRSVVMRSSLLAALRYSVLMFGIRHALDRHLRDRHTRFLVDGPRGRSAETHGYGRNSGRPTLSARLRTEEDKGNDDKHD